MQDIDFDELDRAVSSVSNPTPDVSDTSSAPAADPTPTPASAEPSPAARRSGGRFMDVVHPSSDMRSSSVPERSVPERSTPREEPKKPEFHLSSTRDEEEKTDSSKDWPDPLDFHGFKMDDTPEPKTENTPVVEPEKPAEEEKDEPQQPLESPFLTGAKVEKRPLGAFSSTEPASPVETPEVKPQETTEKPEEEKLLEAPEEEPLLEANNAPSEDAPKEEEKSVESSDEKTPEEVVETTPPVVADEPVGPTSITQQYKEQPSTADQPSGAIYDTEAYHQALTHTPKKKSGALVIVWIAALILVGAGAGAAVYFFVLPML